MSVRRINKSWWVDFRFNRGRIRKKSPDNSRSGALAYESNLRQRLARGESLKEIFKNSEEQEQFFGKFAWVWFNTFVKNNNKASTISNKKYILKNELIPYFGKTPINQITGFQIEKYKAVSTEKKSAKTVNNYLEVLKTCLNSAKEWLELNKIPKIKKLKVPPAGFDFLTEEECKLLLSKIDGVWRQIVLTAMRTGLRLGELRGLRWQDINWSNRTLTVNHSWCNYQKGLVPPKSNRTRSIPLTHDVFTMLFEKKRQSGFVFLDEFGGMFNDKRFNLEMEKACEVAGLRKITCHKLRHTFASHLAMAGAPVISIQQLMGHADVKTTMRYAHLSKSSLKETIDLLEPRINFEDFGQPVGNRSISGKENPKNILMPSQKISLF